MSNDSSSGNISSQNVLPANTIDASQSSRTSSINSNGDPPRILGDTSFLSDSSGLSRRNSIATSIDPIEWDTSVKPPRQRTA